MRYCTSKPHTFTDYNLLNTIDNTYMTLITNYLQQIKLIILIPNSQ